MEDTIKLVLKIGMGKTTPDISQGFAAYYSHNTHVAEVANIEMINGQPSIKKITVAVDCGIVVNPTGAKNQIEGGAMELGMLWGTMSLKRTTTSE